jgi:NAD(P)-dependent dehydrogenase (short-subunit alcohol dehydrogenase family)
MKLSNAVVLVSGGSSGLGAATARKIVAGGGSVVIADLNANAGTALAADLGPRAMFAECDVTSSDSIAAAIGVAMQTFGGLNGAVCCAGILGASRVVGRDGPHDLEAFRRVIDVNLIGTFNVLRLAAQAMSERDPTPDGERGVIVMTSSVSAYEGQIGQAAYSASKGAVASMTLPIARELGKLGIRVVSIAPGVFETPMMQAAPKQVRDSLAAQIPFPARFGEPEEFASLVCHVFENLYLNGSVIRYERFVRA